MNKRITVVVRISMTLLFMVSAGIIDLIIVPLMLSSPGIVLISYAPGGWKWLGIPLLLPVLPYGLLYIFIRPTDDAFPFGLGDKMLMTITKEPQS